MRSSESELKAFSCRMCGECCRGEGGIFLAEGEAERIARFLGQPLSVFLEESCELKRGRRTIRTGAEGYCRFHEAAGICRIHPVKPARCREWPFFAAIVADRDTWEDAKAACPGINPDCSFEEFVRQSGK